MTVQISSPLPLLIFGTAGASKEAYTLIKQINKANKDALFAVEGFVAEKHGNTGTVIIESCPVICSDESFDDFISSFSRIGILLPFGEPKLKRKIYERISHYKNLIFPSFIHPAAVLDMDTTRIGKGNLIFAGAVFAAPIEIGCFNSFNRCSTVGHDVIIGNYNTMYPCSVISGCTAIADGCSIGANATILQGLSLDDDVTVGAGAVVTKSISKGKTVAGVPAKEILR